MKELIQISCLILTAFILMISCTPKYNIQAYTLDRNLKFCDSCADKKVWTDSNVKKIISLEPDSILNYTVIYGHLGSYAKMKYRIINDTLITDKESLNGIPLTERKSDKEFPNKFIYSKDSLRNIETNELFYANNNQKRKNKLDQFYVILENEAFKLKNRRQVIRFIKKIDPEKKVKQMDRDSAKILFGIDRRFVTFRIIE